MENFKQIETKSVSGGLSQIERNNIKLVADLRRQQVSLRGDLLKIIDLKGGMSKLDDYGKKIFEVISKETASIIPLTAEENKDEFVDRLISQAEMYKGTVPNFAAACYSKIAKIKFYKGEDAHADLEKARQYVEKAKVYPKSNLTDLIPEAMMIGVESKIAETMPKVSYEKAAKIASHDDSILKDYALTLREDERAKFLESIPEDKRKRVSAIMDNALSRVLRQDLVVEEEKPLQEIITERTRGEIEEILASGYGKREIGLIRELAGTLSNIKSDESKKALRDVGVASLAGEADQEKNKEKVSYAARILYSLLEIDQNKGGNLAMKFLSKQEIPERLFIFFCDKLTKTGFITNKTDRYLSKDNIPFLRKLIAGHPNQFNTVIDTISKIKNYEPKDNQEEIFSAIKDLESLTPIIFNRYRKADGKGKKELARKITELKPKFFRNTPIKNILKKEDREILTEMVYLAYKPVGMSFEKVEELISKLNDQVEDLSSYKFPEDGYDLDLSHKKAFAVKEGASVDFQKLQKTMHLFSELPSNKNEDVRSISLLFGRLAKAGTDFNPEEITKIFSLVNGDEMVAKFYERYKKVGKDKAYNCLSELKEILGIYFKDNYEERLANFLGANNTTEATLIKILSNPERQEVLKRKIGEDGDDIDWNKLDDRKNIAHLLSKFISTKVIKSLREDINRDLNKFVESKEGEAAIKDVSNLKAYISKNIGSFFAKASAGICTAEDIPLFKRDDHFHINVVENDEFVRANIQAYIINEDNKKSLVLRGFNPNMDFLSKIDVADFCEGIISIAKKFQQDNQLDKVYIVEQTGWHPLSNRENVAKYMVDKYIKGGKGKNAKRFDLKISSSHSVGTIYEV